MVTAAMVKELRDKTGAAMMFCKEALVETNGDMEAAVDWLRKKGTKVADKKASRDASQGLIAVKLVKDSDWLCGVIVEVNCETDFVARNANFQAFVAFYANRLSMAAELEESELTDIITKIGENVKLGRRQTIIVPRPRGTDIVVGSYIHNKVAEGMGSIGVIVLVTAKKNGEVSDELNMVANDIAMHIAATNPKAIDVDDLDEDFIAKEREIFVEQARDTGKPEAIIEKMVEGRMQKVLREVTLVNQPFVKDPDKKISKLLEEHNAEVADFVRFQIGE